MQGYLYPAVKECGQ